MEDDSEQPTATNTSTTPPTSDHCRGEAAHCDKSERGRRGCRIDGKLLARQNQSVEASVGSSLPVTPEDRTICLQLPTWRSSPANETEIVVVAHDAASKVKKSKTLIGIKIGHVRNTCGFHLYQLQRRVGPCLAADRGSVVYAGANGRPFACNKSSEALHHVQVRTEDRPVGVVVSSGANGRPFAHLRRCCWPRATLCHVQNQLMKMSKDLCVLPSHSERVVVDPYRSGTGRAKYAQTI